MANKKWDEDDGIQQNTNRKSYRPLDNSGNNYAKMAGMTDLDQAALDAAKQSYNAANAAGDQKGMNAAHQQAEAIRKQYGYSGGSDGSQYLPTGAPQKFTYESAPAYTSKYQSQIDELTDSILNQQPFSYDYQNDPLYQQYAESYTRSGQRAMQDTLGQIAARTGGLASSYATTASQQAYDNYMAALSDKIPELWQLAYSMYQDDRNNQRANLEMLTALEQGDYAKYLNLLNQYNTDRSFQYGNFRDQIADERYGQEWEYQKGRDQIADERYDREWEYGVQQDAKNDARARVDSFLTSGGKVANLDPDLVESAGYTQAELAAMERYYATQTQPKSYSGGSSMRGQSGGSFQSDLTDDANDNGLVFATQPVPGARGLAEQDILKAVLDPDATEEQRAQNAQRILDGYSSILTKSEYNDLAGKY